MARQKERSTEAAETKSSIGQKNEQDLRLPAFGGWEVVRLAVFGYCAERAACTVFAPLRCWFLPASNRALRILTRWISFCAFRRSDQVDGSRGAQVEEVQ